jgi:hypothetical protein
MVIFLESRYVQIEHKFACCSNFKYLQVEIIVLMYAYMFGLQGCASRTELCSVSVSIGTYIFVPFVLQSF